MTIQKRFANQGHLASAIRNAWLTSAAIAIFQFFPDGQCPLPAAATYRKGTG